MILSNNRKVIIIIDANDKKDMYTHLCRDVLNMSQLATGDTWYKRQTQARINAALPQITSRNDIIFYKNLNLRLVRQLQPRNS